MEVTTSDLLAELGALYVENKRLRAMLEAERSQSQKKGTQPTPLKSQEGESAEGNG